MFKVFRSSGIEGSYSVSNNPLFVSNSCWSIFPAKHRTTKKKVSVWQFNRKEYEARLLQNGAISRHNKDLVLHDVYDNLRKQINGLAKFKHPNILTIIEPLEEHKSRWLFVTEYVTNDLATLDKRDLDEIIVSKGLLQVSTGLKFLHQSVSAVHLNLCPSSILITESFDWKISGLQFFQVLENGAVAEKFIDPLDERMPQFLSVDFRFSSPNLLLKHNVDFIDDLFSIAALMYYLFNDGGYMIHCTNSSLLDYERSIKKLNHALEIVGESSTKDHAYFSKIPENYKNTFFELFTRTQESSNDVIELSKPITVDDLINSNIFNNDLIKMLNVVDEFDALPNSERISFLSTLRNEIVHFPKVLIINKFIPVLSGAINQYVQNPKKMQNEDEQIVTLSMENLLLLSKSLSSLTFTDKVYPTLTSALGALDLDSIKALMITNIDTIREKLGVRLGDHGRNFQTFQQFLMDLFEKSLSHASALPSSIRLQETLLQNLKPFVAFQSYNTLTSKIFPAIGNLFSTTTSLKIKNLTIQAFILMIDGVDNKSLDNYIIAEKLMPLARKTQPANLRNPDLLSNMLSLYETVYNKMKGNQGTISVDGEEKPISELLLDSVFFEVWKLSKYVKRKSDMEKIFGLIADMDKYLRGVTEERVRNLPLEPEAASTNPDKTVPSAIDNTNDSGNNDDDDDDFGNFEDFTTAGSTPAPVSKPKPRAPQSAPLKLEKTKFGSTSSSSAYTPMQARPKGQPRSKPQPKPRPVSVQPAAPKTMAELMAEKNKTSQPTQTSQAGHPSPAASYSVMQPMRATRASSGSPSPAQSPAPEWGSMAATKKNPAQSNSGALMDSLI